MKLIESTKSKIIKDKNGQNIPHSESTEAVSIHYNIVNNDYLNDSRVSYTFIHNKSFNQLLDISLKAFIFLKTFDSEFLYIEVWFTNQNSKLIVTEEKNKYYISYVQNNQNYSNLYSDYSIISNTEYDRSGNSNSSFHLGADILYLLLLNDFFPFFHV